MKKILKAIAVLLVATAFIFTAGCTEENDEPIEKGQVVTEADNGKTLTLNKGENIVLNLKENPTTGYTWELDLSRGLTVISDEYSTDPATEDYEGSGGIHSWIIEAEDTGSQQIDGIYKRSWENTTGEEETFTLTVEVV